MFLVNCIHAFGFRGLLIYLQLKLHLTETISLPWRETKVHIRPRSADEYTFREIFIRREYDIKFPAKFSPRWIIDAGANIGLTSVFFSIKYPSAKILAIEPDKENYQRLLINTSAISNIDALRAALWVDESNIEVIDEGYGLRGFTVRAGATSNEVNGITINSLIAKYNIDVIDILKIDIEGSEKEIFEKGYEEWLPRTKCLVIELHDRMKPGCSKAVLTALTRFNFSLEVKGENLVFFNQEFHPRSSSKYPKS